MAGELTLNDSLYFSNLTLANFFDLTRSEQEHIKRISERGPLHTVLLMTLVYTSLLITGVIGNICTCIVIAKVRSMHTATNYYLFSLAVSDLILLVMGLPQELYQLWVPHPYIFGEVLCVLRGFTAEMSTNASILTITAFTVERYVAICHPLKSHTMSKLSRAVKTILLIWCVAALCAIPVSLQFGVIYGETASGRVLWETAACAVKHMLKHAFEVATFLFFVAPMVVISLLYVKIGIRLRRSGDLAAENSQKNSRKNNSCNGGSSNSRKCIVKMLVAVVVSFFLCWSPFHAQRLMAIYIRSPNAASEVTYTVLTYVSGVTYYLSATINPILYQLMSRKFQQAFKDIFTIFRKCSRTDVDDDFALETQFKSSKAVSRDKQSFSTVA